MQISPPSRRRNGFVGTKAIVALQLPIVNNINNTNTNTNTKSNERTSEDTDSNESPENSTKKGADVIKEMTASEAGLFQVAYLCSTRLVTSTSVGATIEVVLEEQVKINSVRRKPKGLWIHQASVTRLSPPPAEPTEAPGESGDTKVSIPAQSDSDDSIENLDNLDEFRRKLAAEKEAMMHPDHLTACEILDEILTSVGEMLKVKPDWHLAPEAKYILEQAEARETNRQPLKLCLLAGNLIHVIQSHSVYQVR